MQSEIKENSTDAGAVFCETLARRKQSFPAVQPQVSDRTSNNHASHVPTRFWAPLFNRIPCAEFGW